MDQVTLSVEIETNRLNAAFTKLAIVTGRSFGSIVKQNARLVAWNLAFDTRTAHMFGMDLAVRKAMDYIVFKNVGRMFISSKAIYGLLRQENAKLARSFARLIQQGNYSAAELLLQTSSLKQKDASIGPLPGGLSNKQRDQSRPLQIVPDAKSITAYAKERAKMVGFGKAGWITAGSQLGSIARVPAWITRHRGKAPGTADDNSQRIDPHVTLHNHVRYIGDIITNGNIAHALAIQANKMEQHIEHVLVNSAREVGFLAHADRTSSPLPLAA